MTKTDKQKQQRQAIYQRQCEAIVENLTRPPISGLVKKYDNGLSSALIGGRCITLLKAIHGGTLRLVWHIIADQINSAYYRTKGKLWRLRHKLRGLSDDEIDELIFADDEYPEGL